MYDPIQFSKDYSIEKESAIKNPLTTIIISSYNSEATIERAVLSALTQDTKIPYHITIVDDGSRVPVKCSLEKLLGDPRINLYRENNQGVSKGLNLAGYLSKSKYLMQLDADDELLPEAVISLTTALESDPNLVYVYSDGFWIGPLPKESWGWEKISNANPEKFVNSWIKPEFSNEGLLREMFIGHARGYKRDAFLEVGGFNPSYRFGEDWDFALKMSEVGDVKRVPKKLHKYYLLSTGATSSINLQLQSEQERLIVLNALKRRGLSIPSDFEVTGGKSSL